MKKEQVVGWQVSGWQIERKRKRKKAIRTPQVYTGCEIYHKYWFYLIHGKNASYKRILYVNDIKGGGNNKNIKIKNIDKNRTYNLYAPSE